MDETKTSTFSFEYLKGLFKKSIPSNSYDLERKKYYETTSTKEYVKWMNTILTKIYDDLPLVELYGRKHMVVAHKSAEKMSYPFNSEVWKFGNLKSFDLPEYHPDSYQQHYYQVMSANIKKPDLIGFELESYQLNNKDEITGFNANVCQYKHTVVTSHILEYELYDLYCKNKGIVSADRQTILNQLPYRKKIHEGQTNKDVVLKGANRHSLLSVQMMIVCYDETIKDYFVLFFKRSEKVAIKPNYWHIVPAGGFEIFEQEKTREEYFIEENFDVQLALFRELLEELYNGKDFEDNEGGADPHHTIYSHPAIIELEELIKSKQAHLDFLGNVTDLTTLRAELSFLLVVDDPKFIRTKFNHNFEGAKFRLFKIKELEKALKNQLLYPSSAGLLELSMQSPLMKKKVLAIHEVEKKNEIEISAERKAGVPIYEGKEPFIFISYSHAETDIVKKFIQHMTEQGYRIWYDEGIKPNEDYQNTIQRKVRESSYFIAFITERYLTRKDPLMEMLMAMELRDKKQLKILPIILEDYDLDELYEKSGDFDSMNVQESIGKLIYQNFKDIQGIITYDQPDDMEYIEKVVHQIGNQCKE